MKTNNPIPKCTNGIEPCPKHMDIKECQPPQDKKECICYKNNDYVCSVNGGAYPCHPDCSHCSPHLSTPNFKLSSESEDTQVKKYCGGDHCSGLWNLPCDANEHPKVEAAQEKQECSNCKETIKNCACMRNKCIKCGKSIGNITFTKCDDCFSLSETTEWEKQFHDEIWNKFDLGLEFRTVVKETIEAFIASVVDKEKAKILKIIVDEEDDTMSVIKAMKYLKHKE